MREEAPVARPEQTNEEVGTTVATNKLQRPEIL